MGADSSSLAALAKEPVIAYVGKGITQVPQGIPPNCIVHFLNLSNNKIQNLPPNLRNLTNLVLSNNSIHSLSLIGNSITTYQNLESLDLSNNAIKSMGNLLESLPSLRRINLLGNKLESLQFSKTKIEAADLAMNKFSSCPLLPETIVSINMTRNRITMLELNGLLPKLTKLCASCNEIASVSSKAVLNNLFTIDLSRNKLSSLPNFAQIAPRLHQIDISSNRIPALPILPRTTSEIYASNNKLRSIPDFIATFSCLIVADFSHNYIKEIQVLLPSSLQSLILVDNCIESIASAPMASLLRLLMMQNKLTEVPNLSGNFLVEYYLSRNHLTNIKISNFSKNVMRIDLSHNDIESLPKDLFTFPSLTHLFLGYNKIKKIPSTFKDSSLIVFSINGNPIEKMPSEYPETLEQFYISNCNLSEIPVELSSLEDFIELDASNNSISSLPMIKTLQKLYLSKNMFVEFPQLPEKLKYLDISFNHLPSIHGDLTSDFLEFLDLSFNDISVFPKSIFLPSLKSLKLQSNPLISSIKSMNFPVLEYIDVSSTSISFDVMPSDSMVLVSSELGLFNNMLQRVTILGDTCAYAKMCGIHETQEDALVLRSGYLTGVNLYALVDGRGGSNSSPFIAYKIVKFFTEEDDLFTEQNMKRVLEQIYAICAKKHILSVPSFGIILTYGNEIITLCTGNVRMLVIGKTVREIVSQQTYGKPQEVVTLNRTHGPLSYSHIDGEAILYHLLPQPLIEKKPIGINDKWLLLISAGVHETLSIEEMTDIAQKGSSAAEIAYDIRNAAFGNMCCDNISVVVLDLSAIRV